jgi:Putative lipoprotein
MFIPIGMYQFSLSSLDEVISTSNKVISDGNKLGAIIMPNNELGRDLRDVYKSTFESMGGMILDEQFYNPNNQDFTDELKELLIINKSENRHRRLSANLAEFIAFEPRRRQDIDFIFLLTTDITNAKLLKSQLDYHLSGDDPIPIYSTSNIFSLRENMDDLEGVIFTDAPWVIDQQSWLRDLPSKLMKFWPGDAIQSRQNAMGYDAYFLTSKLAKQNNNYLKEFNGATGQLYMDSENKIRRRLAWAKLIDGKTEVTE